VFLIIKGSFTKIEMNRKRGPSDMEKLSFLLEKMKVVKKPTPGKKPGKKGNTIKRPAKRVTVVTRLPKRSLKVMHKTRRAKSMKFLEREKGKRVERNEKARMSLSRNAARTMTTPEKKQPKMLASARREPFEQRKENYSQTIADVRRGNKGKKFVFEEVMEYMACPIASIAQRFSDIYTLTPTAVAVPWARTPVGVDAVNLDQTASEQIDSSDSIAFFFRDPLRSMILYDANEVQSQWSYNAIFEGEVSTITLVGNRTESAAPILWYVPNGTTFQAHGPVWYAGRSEFDSLKYFWIDGTSTNVSQMIITISGAIPANNAIDFNLVRYNGGELYPATYTGRISSGSTTVTINLASGDNQSAYYGLSYQMVTTLATVLAAAFNVTLISVVIQGTSSVFRHLCLPGLPDNLTSTAGIRINAVSGMITNTAAPNYRSGQVVGFQIPQGEDWVEYAFNTQAKLGSSVNSGQLDLENGMYGYLKATQGSDFFLFENYLNEQGGKLQSITYPLEGKSDYLCIYAVCHELLGRQYYWTGAYGIEYITTDVWRETEPPELPEKAFETAVVDLKYMQQWHTNVFHLSDIWDFIKNAGEASVGAVNAFKTMGTILG